MASQSAAPAATVGTATTAATTPAPLGRTANKIVLTRANAGSTAANPKAAKPAPAAAAATAASGVTKKGGMEDPHHTFEALDADSVMETMNTMTSLCMNCHAEDAETNVLLTRIPYFRDVIIMSTVCPHCHYRTNEIQPANEIAEKGVRYEVKVAVDAKAGAASAAATKADLNRQIIKSESATLRIPTIDFEIPAATSSKRGEINTLEGFLVAIAENLELLQPERRTKIPEVAAQLQTVIDRIRGFSEGKESFTFVIDDPAGNSFVENLFAAERKADPRVTITHYQRTTEQQIELGYQPDDIADAKKPSATAAAAAAAAGKGINKAGAALSHSERVSSVSMDESMFAKIDSYFDVTERAASLPGDCPACKKECDTRMCIVDVPFFKDIILMVTQCENCGYKDSEVKPAGEVSEKGCRVTLKVNSKADLKRDLLKSDACGCSIPELELELQAGTLGGKYTTLEGLFNDIKESLTRVNPFSLGDSAEANTKSKMKQFIAKMDDMLFDVKQPFHFILDDPMGNSFIQNFLAPKPDPNLTIEWYDRTFEQNEELGLNDIKTDGYNAELAAELKKTHAPANAANGSGSGSGSAPATAPAPAAAAADVHKPKPSEEFSFPAAASSRFADPKVQVTATGSAPMVAGTNANATPVAADVAAATTKK